MTPAVDELNDLTFITYSGVVKNMNIEDLHLIHSKTVSAARKMYDYNNLAFVEYKTSSLVVFDPSYDINAKIFEGYDIYDAPVDVCWIWNRFS
jgi:hypothetical protein